MDLGSLFIILAILIGVGLFVSRPFLEKKSSPSVSYSDPKEHRLSELMAERDRILNAIQELDFDAALGKIPTEDYPVQRSALIAQGAGVLRSLDQLQSSGPREGEVATEERLEAVIAARKIDAAPSSVPQPVGNGNNSHPEPSYDDELENILANRRRERQGKSAGFCPQCGRSIQKIDRFCPKCGAKLA
jgi:hypothetical protein